MDKVVKQSIEARRNAFSMSYVINDDSIKKEIDNLFKKISDLGEKCTDALDFETKFSASPLNTEYNNLFIKIGTTCKAVIPNNIQEVDNKSDKKYLKEEVESDVKYVLKDLSMPARRKAREELDSKLRDTPFGKIEQLSNTASVFRRIFKK